MTFIRDRISREEGVAAWRGRDAQKHVGCEFERKSSDVFCLQLSPGDAGDPHLNNAVQVRLVD